jgi:hypothetical protein
MAAHLYNQIHNLECMAIVHKDKKIDRVVIKVLKSITEIVCGNKKKVKINNELSEEHTFMESDKASLCRSWYSKLTFRLPN